MKNFPQFDPPNHLSPRAQSLWQAVVPSHARSVGRLAMVQTALEALDRADEARAAVSLVGMTSTTKTTGAIHVHPLVKVERESRQQFAKLWRELNLQFDRIDGMALENFLKQLQK